MSCIYCFPYYDFWHNQINNKSVCHHQKYGLVIYFSCTFLPSTKFTTSIFLLCRHTIYDNKKGDDFMQNNNNNDFSKSNYLRNGNKTQNQYAKSSFNTTIEKPKKNESGIEAEKRGF